MDHEDEFLNTFFTQVAQLCSDKAKESVVSNQQSEEIITYACARVHPHF